MKKILALLACLLASPVAAQTTLPMGQTGGSSANVQMRDTSGTWVTWGQLNNTTHSFVPSFGNIAANTYLGNNTASPAAASALTFPACATPSFLAYTNGTGVVCSAIGANALTNAQLAQVAANTIVGNFTASTANRSANTINGGVSCSTALTYTNGTGFGCATSAVSSITPVAPLNATQSPITSSASLYSNNVGSPSEFRLTLTTGTPVMIANVAAATSILLSPYNGASILMWNTTTSSFVQTVCAEMSNVLANSSTGNAGPAAVVASGVYDLFAWNSGTLTSPTCTLSRGPAWTNSTTRSAGTAIARTGGVLLNSVTITNGPGANQGLYVGTFVADSGGGTVSWNTGTAASGGGAALLDVWNMYNRVSLVAAVIDNGASYTYTTATVRQARASAGNQVSLVKGVQEDAVTAHLVVNGQLAAALAAGESVSIGLDSTTTFTIPRSLTTSPAAAIEDISSSPNGVLFPAIGLHIISSNEQGDGVNANTFNFNANNTLYVMSRM